MDTEKQFRRAEKALHGFESALMASQALSPSERRALQRRANRARRRAKALFRRLNEGRR